MESVCQTAHVWIRTSDTEAEYMAAGAAVKESWALKKTLGDFNTQCDTSLCERASWEGKIEFKRINSEVQLIVLPKVTQYLKKN